MRPLLLAFAVIVGAALVPAAAQNVQNPLRPAPRTAPPATSAPAAAAPSPAVASPAAGETAKPKRERSAKQKANDDKMRACGAEWRQGKADLQAKGMTWRKFLGECRKRT